MLWIFKSKKLKALPLGAIKDEAFNFDLISRYFKNRKNKTSYFLSDRTCEDLDFEEFFMFVDRTNSRIGQQYLYYKLRSERSNAATKHEYLIEELTRNKELREKIQQQLLRLGRDDSYHAVATLFDTYIKAPKYLFVLKMLSISAFFTLIATIFRPELLLLLLAIFMVNMAIHYYNKRNLYVYLKSIPQLLLMNDIANKLQQFKTLNQLNSNIGNAIKTIYQIRRRVVLLKSEVAMQGDLQSIAWTFLELLKILFIAEPLLLFDVLKQLDTKREQIEEVFCFIGEIDSLLSVISLRKGLDFYCKPTIKNDSSSIVANKMMHPLIFNCVPNNINSQNKSVLLTGSNMSGKTSFIRAIGLNVISGLTLNTCFAESFKMPLVRLYTSIRISDDLLNDKSYYFEEVLTIKNMLDIANNKAVNLFLLDEIFKGTNTVERISAGKAILNELAKNNNIVFVATHDIELTELLSNSYNLYHFSEQVADSGIHFDYQIKPGKLQNRNAIKILQVNNYPPHIIDEAIALAQKMDSLTKTKD